MCVGGHTKGKGVAASSHVSTEKDSKSHSKSTKSHPGVVMANQIQINIAQDTVGIAKPPGKTEPLKNFKYGTFITLL